MKTRILIILLYTIVLATHGQTTAEFEDRLYQAYVEDRIQDWKIIISEMDAAYMEENDTELLYSLCFAQYGYIGHCIGKEKEKEAKASLKHAKKRTRELEKILDGRHDVLALQGALYGYQIILSKFSSLYLGPKSFKLIKTASASSDKYFNCSLEYGNIRYFTPKFLGGSKEEAISYYEKAVKILENQLSEDDDSWIYINSLLLLSKAYYDTDLKTRACEVYKRILSYEPRVEWIRKEMNEKCNE